VCIGSLKEPGECSLRVSSSIGRVEWTYVATPEKMRIPIIPHVVNTPINDDNDK
jgi:hypothetical protein